MIIEFDDLSTTNHGLELYCRDFFMKSADMFFYDVPYVFSMVANDGYREEHCRSAAVRYYLNGIIENV